MNKGLRPDPRTMPVTREYAEGHERTFGNTEKKPGRYVWDPVAKALVPVAEYEPNRDAAKSRLFTDRYMEKDRATDGTDISNRRRRKEYMKMRGLADASDYKPDYSERVRARQDREETKSIRDSVERTVYKMYKP